MDHRGLRERLTGAGCPPCGAAVPVDRMAVLAGPERDLHTLLRDAGPRRSGASASAT